jgi:hypothetical protein
MPWRPSGRPVETLGTTAFSPPVAVRQVATSGGPSIGKHPTFHTSNSLGLIGLFAGRSGRSKALKFRASAICGTWFPRYHTLRPRELLLDQKMSQSAEEYAKSMVWYRTTFILLYESTRLSSPTPYTSASSSARRSHRKNPEIVHAGLCVAAVVNL